MVYHFVYSNMVFGNFALPLLQAIEAFALMVKTTAQTLQAFGTELAETEIPNDAEATSNLLHTHTVKKEKMKVRYAFMSFA